MSYLNEFQMNELLQKHNWFDPADQDVWDFAEAAIAMYVAATEAAKATGTAGEPPLATYCTGALAQIAADNPHLLEFALQLLGAAPCKECGFVKQHCRCPTPAEAARQPAQVGAEDAAVIAEVLACVEYYETKELADKLRAILAATNRSQP